MKSTELPIYIFERIDYMTIRSGLGEEVWKSASDCLLCMTTKRLSLQIHAEFRVRWREQGSRPTCLWTF